MLKTFNSIDELINICLGYKYIYLYGAGLYGRIYKSFLEESRIKISGFLTTDKMEDKFCGVNVFEARGKLKELNDNSCVILSLSARHHKQVLKEQMFNCNIYRYNEEFDVFFTCLPYLRFLEKNGVVHYDKYSCNDVDSFKHILIVQIEVTFGDVVWSTAFLRELRRNFPNSKISFVINKVMLKLFSECPYVDEFIPYCFVRELDYVEPDVLYNDIKKFCKNNLFEYDAVFLPRYLPSSGIEVWENVFISNFVKTKFVFAHALSNTTSLNVLIKKFEPYFSEIVTHTIAEHEVVKKLSLISACGGRIKNDSMELWINETVDSYAGAIINQKNNIYVAIGLVGSQPMRSWPAVNYNELIRKLKKMNYNLLFVLCGGGDAKEAAGKAIDGNEDVCIDLTGKTDLLQVAAVVKRCDLYIGSDTGLMHVASAFSKPVIEISPSLPDSPQTYAMSPVRTGPWRVPNIIIRPPHALGNCKYLCSEKFPHCITLIKVDEVFNGVVKLIKNYGNVGRRLL